MQHSLAQCESVQLAAPQHRELAHAACRVAAQHTRETAASRTHPLQLLRSRCCLCRLCCRSLCCGLSLPCRPLSSLCCCSLCLPCCLLSCQICVVVCLCQGLLQGRGGHRRLNLHDACMFHATIMSAPLSKQVRCVSKVGGCSWDLPTLGVTHSMLDRAVVVTQPVRTHSGQHLCLPTLCCSPGAPEARSLAACAPPPPHTPTYHEVVLVLDMQLLLCEHMHPQVVVLQQRASKAGSKADHHISWQLHCRAGWCCCCCWGAVCFLCCSFSLRGVGAGCCRQCRHAQLQQCTPQEFLCLMPRHALCDRQAGMQRQVCVAPCFGGSQKALCHSSAHQQLT